MNIAMSTFAALRILERNFNAYNIMFELYSSNESTFHLIWIAGIVLIVVPYDDSAIRIAIKVLSCIPLCESISMH